MRNLTTQLFNRLAKKIYEDNILKIGKRFSVPVNATQKSDWVVTHVIDELPSGKSGLQAVSVVNPFERKLMRWHLRRYYRTLIIVVRGSNGTWGKDAAYDWLEANVGELTSLNKPRQTSGLLRFFKHILTKDQRVNERTQIYITGHSLGGALAAKLGIHYADRVTRVYTFSSANPYYLLTATQKKKNKQRRYHPLIQNYYSAEDMVHLLPPAPDFVGQQLAVDFLPYQPDQVSLPEGHLPFPKRSFFYHELDNFKFNSDGSINGQITADQPSDTVGELFK